jgi:hypothetical protein
MTKQLLRLSIVKNYNSNVLGYNSNSSSIPNNKPSWLRESCALSPGDLLHTHIVLPSLFLNRSHGGRRTQGQPVLCFTVAACASWPDMCNNLAQIVLDDYKKKVMEHKEEEAR